MKQNTKIVIGLMIALLVLCLIISNCFLLHINRKLQRNLVSLARENFNFRRQIRRISRDKRNEALLEFAEKIPPEMRVITVPVSIKSKYDRALLRPECNVNVKGDYRLSGQDSVSGFILSRIRVIAVNREDKPNGTSQDFSVTLLVDKKQAEALSLASENGKISLFTVRNPLDKNQLLPTPGDYPFEENDIWKRIDYWQLIPEDNPRRLQLLISD